MAPDAIRTKLSVDPYQTLLLTDGWERSSRHADAAGLRAKIRNCDDLVQVSITGFVNRRTQRYLKRLAEDLGLPADSCCLSPHDGDQDSIYDSITSMLLDVVRLAVFPKGPAEAN